MVSARPESEGQASGTRFKLFPQPPFLAGFEEPETVWVSPPAGSLGPGPSDDWMYVVHPVGKSIPYGTPVGRGGELYLPPWDDPVHSPALPDEYGHFDYLEPGTPEFEAAHLYGVARFVLDIWEGYFGRPIRWHFRDFFDRMELSILPGLNNATMGYGFMEVGGYETDTGEYRPFSLNFDIIAHEIGHSIIYEEVGLPSPHAQSGEYYGFHESAADLVALISSLHFDSVVDHVLEHTRGNLYTLNKLNRIGELSQHEQIRAAANVAMLSDFAHGWVDEHALAQPLTGAMFDIFVDMFHESLLERGLISSELEELSDRLEDSPEYESIMQPLFDEAFEKDPEGFRETLEDTRDIVARHLATAWTHLSPDHLDYEDVGRLLLQVDLEATGGQYQRQIDGNFSYRNIGSTVVGPRLSAPTADSHSFSVRTTSPALGQEFWPRSYLERMRLVRHHSIMR